MGARVLVCEDDVKHAELVRRYLEREGHTAVVVHDGRDAIHEVRRQQPDLLILDLMMPGIDGLDVCRILRTEYSLPILMVTARSTESDLVLGLDLGADDYLTKPCSPRELMARVRALLRRSQRVVVPGSPVPANGPVNGTGMNGTGVNGTGTNGSAAGHGPGKGSTADAGVSDELRVDDLVVDPIRHTVTVGRRPVDCTAGEFALLEVLAGEPNRVFSRRQLLQLTRGQDRYITGRTIDVHVSNLRKKLEVDPRNPARIVTVFGVGYKLAARNGEDSTA